MNEICTDGRFELIAAYKQKLIERTNIETHPEEMAVIDNVLFRFWQMGWLPPLPHGRLIDADALKAKQQEDADLFIGSRVDIERRDEALNAVANIENAPTIIEADGEDNTIRRSENGTAQAQSDSYQG